MVNFTIVLFCYCGFCLLVVAALCVWEPLLHSLLSCTYLYLCSCAIYHLLNTIIIGDEDYNSNQTTYYSMAHLSIGTIGRRIGKRIQSDCNSFLSRTALMTQRNVASQCANVWTRPWSPCSRNSYRKNIRRTCCSGSGIPAAYTLTEVHLIYKSRTLRRDD